MTKISKDLEVGNSGKKLETIIPYLLYDNSSGTAGDVSLSDSVANYDYIELYWFTQYNNCLYNNKFYKPNGKKTTLFYLEGARTDQNPKTNDTFLFWNQISFSDSTISRDNTIKGLTSISGSYAENSNRVFITRVIGYK